MIRKTIVEVDEANEDGTDYTICVKNIKNDIPTVDKDDKSKITFNYE